MEEFQCYFELDDQKRNKEFASLLSRIGALGPAAGVILVVAVAEAVRGRLRQDVQRLFNRFRDNHIVRFALRCATRDVSMAVLGNESYGEGYDASGLPLGDEFKGIGILYGLDRRRADRADLPRRRPGRRGHLPRRAQAPGEGAHAVRRRARRRGRRARVRHRGRPARGDGAATPGCGGRRRPSGSPAEFPMRHADATGESVSAAARARGIPSTDVRWPPGRAGNNRKGCRKADLDARGAAMKPRHMCRVGAARADLRETRSGAAHRRPCRAACRALRPLTCGFARAAR